jgi:hypothetical protein
MSRLQKAGIVPFVTRQTGLVIDIGLVGANGRGRKSEKRNGHQRSCEDPGVPFVE